MLSDSVAQKPIIPVSDGTNTFQNSPTVANCEGCSSIGPDAARRATRPRRAAPPAITSTSGAAQFSNTRTAFMPR